MRLRDRLRELSFELSGAQLGITVTSLAIGALAQSTVAPVLDRPLAAIGITDATAVIAIALGMATLVQMVLGELIPKNVAIARPYPSAITVGLAMTAVNRMFRGIINLFNASADWTVRRFGIEPRDELAGLRSLQELEMIVRASSQEGELDPVETTLLTRAIVFVEKDAADAMIPRVAVEGITSGSVIGDLRTLSRDTGHSRFPVYDGDLDNVIGVAHVKDTFGIPPPSWSSAPISSITQPAVLVPEAMRLDTLLIELQASGRGMAVVIDEYGGTAGIVTVEDIIEEIFGEIEDEHDDPERVDLARGIPGRFHRHEVEEATGFEWVEGGYDTLNGFITDQLDRFPEVGDSITVDGYTIEVTEVDNHLVSFATIHRADQGSEPTR